MLGHQKFIKRSIETFVTSVYCYRSYSTFNRTQRSRYLLHSTNTAKLRPVVRFQSNKTGQKKNIPLIIGIAGTGGAAVYAYFVFNKRPPSSGLSEVDDDDDKPFVYENLKEDLELLNNFGPIPYLLIGAGSASFTAFRAIRTKDPTAKVLMIGEEAFLPYMRPPLSKEMWFDNKSDVAQTLTFTQWNGKDRSLFYESPDYYFSVKELLENKNGGVSVMRGTKVVKVDPVSQKVYLQNGEAISYEKCLVATGSKPKNLSVFENCDDAVKKHVTVFRTIQDFQKLDKISRRIKSVVIVGGGFLGSELACGLAKRGKSTGLKVVQLFPESGNMGKIFPEYLSKWTSKKLQSEGVQIIPEVTIKSVSNEGTKVRLHLSNNEIIMADHVVVAVGADPNTQIAKDSGLEIDENHGGFLVNAEMEARKNLWIAGDAACFYDIKLGRRRVEHHDHAVVSGRLAGENMTGAGRPYLHQSMFWSDLGPEIGYEAIGIVDSSLPTVGVFAKATEADTPKSVVDSTGESIRSETEQQLVDKNKSLENEVPRAPESNDNYGKGVIFYLRENTIVGIILWNVFSKMPIARKIISESKTYDDLTEVAKLFELHSVE
ncbi:Apoptosis-inducing factor 1, mitochondrial, partial [Stegodyphus mimosarum]